MPVTAQPAPPARTANPWPVLAGALLAPVCAWALMRLLGPGLDPELRPIAAALAGLWAASLFLLPGALGSGLALSPLGTTVTLALTAGAGAAVATLATGVQPQVAVLVLVGLMALALAALGDGLRALTGGPGSAVAWTLALVLIIGAAPVWLLPLQGSTDLDSWALDILVTVNPLTHIAVLTGTDWPRSDWFYRHSALGSLRYAYPSPFAVVTWYLLVPIAWLGVRRANRTAGRQGTPTEPVPIPLSPTPN
jgi:hypothetical protein